MWLLGIAGKRVLLAKSSLASLSKQSSYNRTLYNQVKSFKADQTRRLILSNRVNLSRVFIRWNGSANKPKSTMSPSQIVRKLAQFIWPKNKTHIKIRVIIAVGLLIGSKLLNLLVPFLFKDIVDFLSKNAKIQDFGESASDKAFITMIALIIGYGCARSGASLFSELRSAIFATVAQSSVTQLASQVFRHLHKLDLNFHLNRQTGALSKAIDRGTRGVSFVLSALLFNIAPTIVEVAMVSGILCAKFGPNYALVSIGCIGAYTMFTFLTIRWRTKFRVDMNKAENEAGNKAIDSLINYKTVKYFNNDDYEVKRYEQSLIKYQQSAIKTSTSLAVLNFGQNAIFSTGLTAIMLLAGYGAVCGQMTVGDLVMCNALWFQLSVPLNFLATVYREVRQSILDMQNMFDLTTIEAGVSEKPKAPNLIITASKSAIVFDKVRFKYQEGAELLSDLSFEVPSGKKVAFVGASGSGKSTIVRLLYRFYDPLEGRILINDQDIRNVSLDSLRQKIGIVPQDTVLFNETIFYNIHYGNMKTNLEDVYKVAEMCDLHNAIEKMPKKYQTMVGERGLKLSGGEKQRVAIARTMLKNPYIFVYDEATSNLNSTTEQIIMSSLKKLIHGRTSIFIAHKLMNVIDADEIFILEKGKVAERGSHKQLISNPSSLYYSLWKKQAEQSCITETSKF